MLYAEVAELVDAHGSGPCESNLLRVQVPSSALSFKAFRVVSRKAYFISVFNGFKNNQSFYL